MDAALLGLAVVVFLLVAIAFGAPVGTSLLLAGVAGHVLILGAGATVDLLSVKIYGTLNSFTLVAIPLFILMGYLASEAKFIGPLYGAAKAWFGWVPGGLAISTILGAGAFGAISGSSSATAATMGIVAYPEMKAQGYSDRLSTSSIAVAGTLAILIPPSLPLILYGIILEQPIGKLFIASVIPGLLMMVLYAVTVLIIVKINPTHAPASVTTVPVRERLVSLGGVLPVILVFLIVIGGIYGGIFTAMEAAAMGCAAMLAVGLLYRTLSLSGIANALRHMAMTTGMIFYVILGAIILSDFMILTGLGRTIAAILADLNAPDFVVMAVIALIFLVLGMLMDVVGLFMITLPVLFPIVRELGFDLIWFGIFAAILAEACLITPPVGLNVFVLAGIVKGRVEEIFKGVFWFMPAILILLVLVYVFPQLALYLPSQM